MSRPIRCVIFDLDGVLVHTDRFHEDSWRTIAAEEGIAFDPAWAPRLRGVDRLSSLAVILENSRRAYSGIEMEALAERKNALYLRAIESITPADLAPGAKTLLETLRARGIRIAIASSSRNAGVLVDRLGLRPLLDSMADGTDELPAKPDPALFLLAAHRAGAAPDECVVVEDSLAGVEAARRAGMSAVFLGPPGAAPGAMCTAPTLRGISLTALIGQR